MNITQYTKGERKFSGELYSDKCRNENWSELSMVGKDSIKTRGILGKLC